MKKIGWECRIFTFDFNKLLWCEGFVGHGVSAVLLNVFEYEAFLVDVAG